MKIDMAVEISKGVKFIPYVVIALIFALCFSAHAEQQPNSPRLDILLSARIEPFRQGFRELGYIEGKNIVIEWRSAKGNPKRVPCLRLNLYN